MALDQRLVGLWDIVSAGRTWRYEITPTGLFLSHSPDQNYEISADGMSLTVHAPAKTYVMVRQGEPAVSLVGTWSRTHEEDDIETITYNADGTMLTDWGELYFGFYQDQGTFFSSSESRGTVSTEGDAYTHKYRTLVDVSRLEFLGDDLFRLFDQDSGAMKSEGTRRLL